MIRGLRDATLTLAANLQETLKSLPPNPAMLN